MTAERWEAFVARVESRLEEVLVDGAAAIRAILEADPLDGTAIHGFENALRARVRALTDRVDDAWEALLRAGVSPGSLSVDGAGLNTRLELQHEVFRVKQLAVVGRRLKELSDHRTPSFRCPQCAADLTVDRWWAPASVPCGHCGAVISTSPHREHREYVARGAAYLADAYALDAWLAFQEADAAFDALRHPTLDDYQVLEDAAAWYWRTLYAALVCFHPGWTHDQAEREVRGTVGRLRAMRCRPAEVAMRQIGEGLAAGRTSDAELVRWSGQFADTRETVLGALERAAAERGDLVVLERLMPLLHRDEVPWFGKRRWARRKAEAIAAA